MNPPFPPLLEIAFVYLTLLMFGLGYNAWVDWAQRKRMWHVSTSVIVGVFVTLAIKTAAWPLRTLTGWQDGLLLLGCFASSGLPMAVFSLRRTSNQPKSHKRMRWPTAARWAATDSVTELDALASLIETAANKNEITPGFLLTTINRLHYIKGILNSVL